MEGKDKKTCLKRINKNTQELALIAKNYFCSLFGDNGIDKRKFYSTENPSKLGR